VATIKQVAALANVSTATVSYVLNGTGTVTEAVRQRVLQAVAELDYQPSYAARSLRTRSRTLGLVLSANPGRLADPLLAELLAGLTEAAAEQGYYLLLATAEAEQAEERLCQQLVRSGRVEGVVLLDALVDDPRAAFLRQHKVPHVCAGPIPEDQASPSVAVDGRAGAHMAVKHLLNMGYRRIGLIALPSELADSEPRYLGYCDALEEHALEVDPQLIVEAGRAHSDGYEAMQELLSLPEAPDAVLACSDELAFGALHALQDRGINVGPEIGLMGWDDAPLAAYSNPPLTTLHASRHTFGRELARLLIESIEQKSTTISHSIIPMRLMIRRSTAHV
jgi:DNA-binding LacI/PurR family transcriptional regulator